MSSSLTNCDLLSVVILATVPSLRDSFHFLQLSRHFRAGLSHFAATRLGWCRALRLCPDMFRFFRPFGACASVLCIPRLAPWAVFFRRFAAFSLPLSRGDCIGSISQNLVELRSTDSRWRLSPHKFLLS
jgi:hypothetical protein